MICRPGFWKTKEGIEIMLTAMEDLHIQHTCRFLRNKIFDTSTNIRYKTDCREKLIEFGNEAQRRRLIPAGDITEDQLHAIVDLWQTEWNNRSTSPAIRVTQQKPEKPKAMLKPNERFEFDLDERRLDIDL